MLRLRLQEENYLSCNVEISEDSNKSKDSEVYAQNLLKKFEKLIILNKKDLSDSINTIKKIKDPSQIADNIAANLNLEIFVKNTFHTLV